MAPAEFDIVVFGASGFTGRLVAEYLASRYGVNKILKWAIAGRSVVKLAAVRDEIGAANVPVIEADSRDPASLGSMVSQARIILTTVGPYQIHGSALVAACAQAGVDYLDLCGEPAWMREMIDSYEQTAKSTGARVLFSCGFDSIPFELGVWFTQRVAKARLGTTVARVKGRVRALRGSYSGGTIASLKANMTAAVRDKAVLELLKNPFALTPGFTGPEQPESSKVTFDSDLDAWVAPFMMSGINTRNVHRSNYLLHHAYGSDFLYDEMMLAPQGDTVEAIKKALLREQAALAAPTAPKPGQGPGKEEREAGFYDVLFVGNTPDGQQVRVSVADNRDPGYGSTAKIVSETAVCLLDHAADVAAGIWTPVAALQDKLSERMEQRAGLKVRVES